MVWKLNCINTFQKTEALHPYMNDQKILLKLYLVSRVVDGFMEA